MPKYMKEKCFKEPRQKPETTEKEINYQKSKNYKKVSTRKSNHRHYYEKVLIEEIRPYVHGEVLKFFYAGGRCTICGKIQKRRWYFQNEIPESALLLPRVIIDETTK